MPRVQSGYPQPPATMYQHVPQGVQYVQNVQHVPKGGQASQASAMVKVHEILSIDSTKEKAADIQSNMQFIVQTFTELATNHAELKSKYLHARRSAMEKYFIENARMLTAVSFAEWKTLTQEIVQARRYALIVDQLHEQRNHHALLRMELEGAFEQKMAHAEGHSRRSLGESQDIANLKVGKLEEVVKGKTEQVAQLTKENEALWQRWYDQHRILTSFCQHLQGDGPAAPTDPEPVVFAKEQLHDVLRNIDAAYVPPLVNPEWK